MTSILRIGLVWIPLLAVFADPAFAQRAVPVQVVNPPQVQVVEDLNAPVFQPVRLQATSSSFVANAATIGTSLAVDPVPPGKRMVVQHVSHALRGPQLLTDPECEIFVINTAEEHPVPVRRTFGVSGVETAAFSIPITMYLDEGERLAVSCRIFANQTMTGRLAITGHYVNLK